MKVTSANPASIFGLQRKGRLNVGCDADIVLVDLARERIIKDEDTLGLIGWSPYAGRTVKGIPVRTLVRGRTVFADGKVLAEQGYGKMARAVYPGAPARPA